MTAPRSPRAGWVLVALVDGHWRRTLTGDRDLVQARHATTVSAMLRRPHLYYQGHAVGAYDALGRPRDTYPSNPRLADGTRIRWPATDTRDGAVPEVRVVVTRPREVE